MRHVKILPPLFLSVGEGSRDSLAVEKSTRYERRLELGRHSFGQEQPWALELVVDRLRYLQSFGTRPVDDSREHWRHVGVRSRLAELPKPLSNVRTLTWQM